MRSLWLTTSLLIVCTPLHAQKTPVDALGRLDPRSTVTEFLEACHHDNYTVASQYLDLRSRSAKSREAAPAIARQLESILNADAHLDVLRISIEPQGSLTDDPDPNVEHVADVQVGPDRVHVSLSRVTLAAGDPQVWLFSATTVAELERLAPTTQTETQFESHLPPFFVKTELFETPIWKWLAFICLAIVVVAMLRLLSQLIGSVAQRIDSRAIRSNRSSWVAALFEPILIIAAAAAFRIGEEIIAPSALSRIYIGDFILFVVVFAVAWLVINVVELFLTRIDLLLDPRQRQVSHSLLYLGRRTARVVIFIVAGIFVLNNWGYPMTTIIAGLGVSGIAVALAAQQTIANVFGGVSVIGDHPVMVGDFGSFGGLQGTVEDIGMRSTRVRTLSRTVVSIPNANFAGMNLENYSLRDKILFNPTLQVKRGPSKEQLTHGMQVIAASLQGDERLEVGSSAIRISGLTAASYALEIFAYVRTADLDEYYRIQADLFLAINEALIGGGLDLA